MYRKLMFLISLVALLVLTNGTFAGEDIRWDGGGTGDSFCTPENWEDDVVPGPEDVAEMEWRSDGKNTVVIDCVAVVKEFKMPSGGDPCLTIVNIVSGGSLTAGYTEISKEDDDKITLSEFNISGTGSFLALGEDDGQDRIGDDGEVTWTISDDAYVEFWGGVRMGDNDTATVHFIMSGGTLNVLTHPDVWDDDDDPYFRLGDDGGGDVTFSGGSVNVFGNIEWRSRKLSQVILHSGDSEVWCEEDYRIGHKTGKKDSGATCDVTMTGGTLNAKRIRVHDDEGDGIATVIVSGGLMISREEFTIGHGGSSDAVYLTGTGVIQAGDLEIEDDAIMDVNGGTLILDGDKLGTIDDLVVAGKLTGCGSPRGIIAEYNGANPGKTTVTSDCNFDACQAWAPVPADGASEVQSDVTEVILSWTEGDCIGMTGRNSIYFGDDYNKVNDSILSPPEWKGYKRSGINTYNAGNLSLWETFYWRIDQFNAIGGNPPVTKGKVWSFTTGCAAIDGDVNMDCLVNFLDYAELAATFGGEEFWPE